MGEGADVWGGAEVWDVGEGAEVWGVGGGGVGCCY